MLLQQKIGIIPTAPPELLPMPAPSPVRTCLPPPAGLTAADLKGQAPHKLSHFLAALSDLEPGGLPYKTEFAERDGGLVSSSHPPCHV